MYCPRARLLAEHLPASRKDLTAAKRETLRRLGQSSIARPDTYRS